MRRQSGTRLFFPISFCMATLLLLLSSCGPAGTPTATLSNSGKPTNGGVWVVDLANEPDSLIPNASTQTFATLVMQALYAPLFTGTPDGSIQPALTTEIPTVTNGGVSKDAKIWIFHLRPNLVWSDGEPLTAQDVDYTWKLWQDPQFAASSTTGLNDIESAEVSADNLTIVFHLKQSFSPFLQTWTDGGFAPLPKHYFEKIPASQIKRSADNMKPSVVSGPFTISESVAGDHYTLVKNPRYYLAKEGLPHLDKVIFRPVGNQGTILKDLQSGSIDSAWFLDASKITAYKQLSDYKLILGTSSGYEAIHFNQNNPALKDINVRRAFSMAIDRDKLIEVARSGAAIPLCTNHSPVYKPGYQPGILCPAFDLDGANKLLDSAGWKLGPDGVRQKGNLRLEFQYATTANNTWREQTQIINQANFQKIGIKVDIQNYPASTFFSTFLGGGKAGTYDLAEWASSSNYDANDSSNFACDQIGKSDFNYNCDPELDKLLQAEQATADPDQRQEIFNQIHDRLLTTLPVISMYSPSNIAISKIGTHNYEPGPFGASETVNIWDWWCSNGKCPSAS